MTRKSLFFAVLALVGPCLAVAIAGQGSGRFAGLWGEAYTPARSADPLRAASIAQVPPSGAAQMLRHWNEVAVDASGLDHTPEGEGDPHTFGHQLGPGRASRAMAIVHIAVFDAVNSIAHRYRSFSGIRDVPQSASIEAAIARAAHDTLVALFPSQREQVDNQLAADLAAIPDGHAKDLGVHTGRRAARAVLQATARDRSDHVEPVIGVDFITSNRPGRWRQDPVSQIPVALGAFWGGVRPLVISSVRLHRAPRPPALTSRAYAEAFDEVKRLGGDGVTTPTDRTEEQTRIGIYWAYDGTPSLCAPPRLYNQIAMTIADQMGTSRDVVDLARLLALVNVALSDTGIVTWESKYHWNYWRPVTGIREADPGTGPTGRGDGNPDTDGDPTFSPLGAPASNLTGPDFTPPFPAYPSGHAAFGGALFQTLRLFYRTDRIAFTFVSDELNGVTLDNNGVVRPLVPRSFTSLSEAEEENGQSRIYLGIHWAFDKTEGIRQGRRVATEVFLRAARPRP
jgi:hypothetical protein